jgi:PleD family two-component response regulator
VTASFGVAEATGSADWAGILRLADEALYAAKEAGKNRVAAAGGDSPAVLARAVR